MVSDEAVRFWHAVGDDSREVAGAYLGAGPTAAHVHEDWEFAVPENPARLSIGAYRRHMVRASDVAVVPPYDVHMEGSEAEPPAKWRAWYVAPAVIARLFQGAPGFRGPVVNDPSAAGELRALLRAGELGTMPESELCSALHRWLEQFLRGHAYQAAAPGDRPVHRARAYLQARPTQPVSLPDIGAAVGVTTSHLVRSFSRAVGLPPRSYHTQIRLARAQRLLAEGKPVIRVAYECGFADQSHLIRRFKESHGLTPSAFQAQVRGTLNAA